MFPDITNNSANVQNLNCGFNFQGGHIIKTPGAGLIFGGDYIYDNNASANDSTNWWLTHDVIVNCQLWRNGTQNVYGPNGTNTVVTDPTTGALILNVNTGTGTSGNGNYYGQVNIWSGALRVGAPTALGASTSNSNNTYIHGTFTTPVATIGQSAGGFDHGFGRLEIYNGLTLAERLRLDGRIGDAADYDHLVNVSQDNTVNPNAAVATTWTRTTSVPGSPASPAPMSRPSGRVARVSSSHPERRDAAPSPGP